MRIPLLLRALALPLALALGGPAVAGTAIYGLNESGALTVNGTLLDQLPTRFDGRSRAFAHQRWWELAVDGADRYALRRDGLVYRNGEEFDELPSSALDEGTWWNAICMAPGVLYALRADGTLYANGDELVDHPAAGFSFERLACDASHVYALRSDGAVFEDDDSTPRFRFVGGPGLGGAADGASTPTSWSSLALDPVTGDLYALRFDGELFLGELPSGDEEGERVASLPFPSSDAATEDLYVDLEIGSDGVWRALRVNGRLYAAPGGSTPAVVYPTNDTNSRVADLYLDLAVQGTDFWAMRFDGRLFRGSDDELQLDLVRDRYRRIAIGSVAPDLTYFVNPRPEAASYTVVAVEGETIEIPVLVSDIELPPFDLLVTPLLLPTGMSFDPGSRTLDWPAPGPVGNAVAVMQVEDGVNPPRVFRTRIKVVAADTDPARNQKPSVAKISKARALVGVPFTLPIVAVDRDGDALTLSADTSRGPFTSGSPASFDPGTGVLSWTPDFADIGVTTARFLVSDGSSTRALNVRILVVSPLIF